MMLCVLGYKEEVKVASVAHFREEIFSGEPAYGGFLWEDIEGGGKRLSTFHQRLRRNFSNGWHAVALTASTENGAVALGPFAPPTVARAHRSAPFGLYLLSAQRLTEQLAQIPEGEDLPMAIHARLQGPVFCDPLLEVRLTGSGGRNFLYRPPSKQKMWWNAFRYLLGGVR